MKVQINNPRSRFNITRTDQQLFDHQYVRIQLQRKKCASYDWVLRHSTLIIAPSAHVGTLMLSATYQPLKCIEADGIGMSIVRPQLLKTTQIEPPPCGPRHVIPLQNMAGNPCEH